MNEKIAEIIGCDVAEIEIILMGTVFAECAVRGYTPSKIEMLRFKRFILRTGLSPLDGAIYAHLGNTGYEPGLKIDGWLELAKIAGASEISQEYSPTTIRLNEFANDVEAHTWIETTIKLTSGALFKHREFVVENFFVTEAWMSMPNRCNGHKSVAQTIRLFTGIYARDENSQEFSQKNSETPKSNKPLQVDVDEAKPAAEPAKQEKKPAEPVISKAQQDEPVQADTSDTPKVINNVAEVQQGEVTVTEVAQQAPKVETQSEPVQMNDASDGQNPDANASDEQPVFNSTEEVLAYHWKGHKPSEKLKGDTRVIVARVKTDPNLWGAVLQYVQTATSLKECEREWTLAALKQLKEMLEENDGKSA